MNANIPAPQNTPDEIRGTILEIAIKWRESVERLEKIDGKLPSKWIEDEVLALITAARIDELKRITLTGTPNSIDTAVISVPEMANKGDVVLLSIEDRIATLTNDKIGGKHGDSN